MKTNLPDQVSHYRNALEPLVIQEVMQQLQHLSPQLLQYIDPAQVIAYAMNRLPALYATSIKGWTRQQQLAKNKLEKQIFLSVRQGLAAIQQS